MDTSSIALVTALEEWNDARQEWELAARQLAEARSANVPAVATALLKVRVDALEARTRALFETAMTFMDRRPLGP
ncbi:MAG: hypothetical protein K0Q43_5780 [Ramlibacter sp.]|jgi:hypothetical protein|nr:hypothetical protein [Ramlibacter sp.]MCE3269719.1 hypothetical protein [Ramlibacter sp.]MDF2467545.1 hypothetical protein [Ramlibacter sp.]